MSSIQIKETLAHDLADQLRQRIQLEQLSDGDFFMTETQLAEEYNVSRTIVREAVSRLHALGLLESRKRKGLVVRRPDPLQLLSDSLPSLAGSKKDLIELSKLRYVIEVGAIELAVKNATDEQIKTLCSLARDYEDAVRNQEGNDQEDKVEFAFHGLILKMTGSPMIAGMQKVLTEFFALAHQDNIQPGNQENAVWQHHEIAAAIHDRDVDLARSMMRLHFRSYLSSETENQTDV
jgi:GntR family transcriptional regulator, transcriptional repressor for pyruvate dehydrogenase complex